MARNKPNSIFTTIIVIVLLAAIGFGIYFAVDSCRKDDDIDTTKATKATLGTFTPSTDKYTVTTGADNVVNVAYTAIDDTLAYAYISATVTEPADLAAYSKIYIKFKGVNMNKLNITFGDGKTEVSKITGKIQTVSFNFSEAGIAKIKMFLDSYELDPDLYNENSRSIEIYEIGFLA